MSLRFLTVEEVAERQRCSTRTIHERVRRGEIPHRKLPGCRRLLFPEAELDRERANLTLARFAYGGTAQRLLEHFARALAKKHQIPRYSTT